MTSSAEFLITVTLIAIAWLSLGHDIRALTKELRQINGDPALRDRDIAFDDVVARVARTMDDPVQRARDALEQRQ